MSEARRLMVLIPDRISDILVKGEYQPRYYNPGGLFPEVHIVTTTDDRPDLTALQRTVGDARLFVHNVPEQPSLIAGGWERWWHRPLRQWARAGVDLARRIRPQLIRCHGADWNGYLASRIRRKTGVPYVMSLHINPDINPVRRFTGEPLTDQQRQHNAFYEYIEREGLTHADLVMPVYRPILPYLERMGVTRADVCYNILNAEWLRRKASYEWSRPFRIVCVGRLIAEKNPRHIIAAVADLPDTHLTIIGDGPERARLETLAADLGVGGRVEFMPAVPNDELCAALPGFDLFAVHTEYWELNKSVLEALLTGLPVVINRRTGAPVPELQDANIVQFVDDTREAYRDAIRRLMGDDGERRALGERAYAHAQAHWSPQVTERKVVDVYRRVMKAA